jgi:hypothetical protein
MSWLLDTGPVLLPWVVVEDVKSGPVVAKEEVEVEYGELPGV